jgi:hypothetical protein
MNYPAVLIDVPHSCRSVFKVALGRAPDHIKTKVHASNQTHTGRGTAWAGAYNTYEIYDVRRPDWPTEDAERWGREMEWAIITHLRRQREMKVR